MIYIFYYMLGAKKHIFIITSSVMSCFRWTRQAIIQTKNIDFMQSSDHIKIILEVAKDHRKTTDQMIDNILLSANLIATNFLIELAPPWKIQYEPHKASHSAAETSAEYWKRSVLALILTHFLRL